jgi:hypothetical protein
MSYPRDLDDYSDKELMDELNRRYISRQGRNCDYCHRPLGSRPACRHPARHRLRTRLPRL